LFSLALAYSNLLNFCFWLLKVGESALWGNDRVNPCLRYYTGFYNGQKRRNKFTIPGWRTRLHFRGDWTPKLEDAGQSFNTDESDGEGFAYEGLEIKCRRTPNWRRLRPIFDEYAYDYYYY